MNSAQHLELRDGAGAGRVGLAEGRSRRQGDLRGDRQLGRHLLRLCRRQAWLRQQGRAPLDHRRRRPGKVGCGQLGGAAQLHLACAQGLEVLQRRRQLRPRARRICDDHGRHDHLRAADRQRPGPVPAADGRHHLDARHRAARRHQRERGPGLCTATPRTSASTRRSSRSTCRPSKALRPRVTALIDGMVEAIRTDTRDHARAEGAAADRLGAALQDPDRAGGLCPRACSTDDRSTLAEIACDRPALRDPRPAGQRGRQVEGELHRCRRSQARPRGARRSTPRGPTLADRQQTTQARVTAIMQIIEKTAVPRERARRTRCRPAWRRRSTGRAA